jgi:hypothetical protein
MIDRFKNNSVIGKGSIKFGLSGPPQALLSLDSTSLPLIIMDGPGSGKACKCLPAKKKLVVCIDGTSNQFGLKVSH